MVSAERARTGEQLFAALRPKRAMIVTAHPDDCEFMCGGAVAVLARSGWEVDIVVATSGNKGTKDAQMSAQRLAGAREEEQRRAAAILGAREPVFLGFHDGAVLDNDELREQVVYQLRRRRPELVITWDGFRPGFSHRDHRNIGRATYDAIYPAADDHLYHPEHKDEGLAPHRPLVLLLGGSDAPDLDVNISAVLRRKVRAVLAHASQMGGRNEADLLRLWRERARQTADDTSGRPEHRESFRKVVLRR